MSGMPGQIWVNADDFGWTDGQNQAVEKAHNAGTLNRASLFCIGPGFEEAVRISQRNPALRVGVHLAVNEGQPLLSASQLPQLAPKGYFPETLRQLAVLQLGGKLKTSEVLPEWRAQLERALQAGIQVNHLDSHKHVHLLPPLRRALVQLAQEYHIQQVRLPLEARAWRRGPGGVALWLLGQAAWRHFDQAGLSYADVFIGFVWSGAMTAPRLQASLDQARGLAARGQVVEIMVHPARLTPAVRDLQARYHWAAQYQFEAEFDALVSA